MRRPSNQVTEPRAALLEVRGLTLKLGNETVLRDLSFTVEGGERLGVIGPNGAGKTSLLETLAGFLPPLVGEIAWRGRPRQPEARRDTIFYLPDGIRPFPDHRARDVLDLFGTAYAQPQTRLNEFVEALDLGSALHKRVRELSKGFAKRLLLALGLLTRSTLLLLDEPVDGLDLHQVMSLRTLLERLRAEGRTLLLSIHELSLAERLCDRFLLLSEGRLLGTGDLPALRSRAGLRDGGLSDVFLALT